MTIPFVCSFSKGEVIIKWHAFTRTYRKIDDNGNNIEDQKIMVPGVGHSFIVLRIFLVPLVKKETKTKY